MPMIVREHRPLTGSIIRLEPLKADDTSELFAISEPKIWEWGIDQITSREDMERYVRDALVEASQGSARPFAVREIPTGRLIGSTRFGAINTRHQRAEIGWTWLQPSCWRTGANTEMKFLMLREAFEHWHCLRVEFKTDVLNMRSRNAILRLGAVEEGVLRHHMVTSTGRMRDSVYFSILAEEWPTVRERLKAFLQRHPA